jgi:hypothetical protein
VSLLDPRMKSPNLALLASNSEIMINIGYKQDT